MDATPRREGYLLLRTEAQAPAHKK